MHCQLSSGSGVVVSGVKLTSQPNTNVEAPPGGRRPVAGVETLPLAGVATAAGRPTAAATAGVLEVTTGAAEAEAMPAGARACLEASLAQTPACAWTRAPDQASLGESFWQSHSEASAQIAP
jgi:hypothetical protein